jgi:hypothetical protein
MHFSRIRFPDADPSVCPLTFFSGCGSNITEIPLGPGVGSPTPVISQVKVT